MSTRAEIGRSPIAVRRSCSQAGLGPLRTPRNTRPTNSGQAACVAVREIERDLKRRLERPGTGGEITRLQRAEPGRGELARDAEHAEAVAAVRRHGDIDHRPLDPDHLAAGRADRRIRRQLDDSGMVLAEQQLARRAQHAAAVDAADRRLLQRLAARRDHSADRREHRLHAGVHVGRAADHLDRAVAGVDPAAR